MNKTEIEWADYTWNPVTGCKHGCSYCYARKIANRFANRYTPDGGKPFDPMEHPERWSEPSHIKNPSKIFVCSMADMMGEWIPFEWILRAATIASAVPRHTFMFLTKNPARYHEIAWPSNCWLGATATDQESWDNAVEALETMPANNIRFISAEPLMGRIEYEGAWAPDWLVVGAMTGPGAVKPDPVWVYRLAFQQRIYDRPVFIKENCPFPEGEERFRQFPKGG